MPLDLCSFACLHAGRGCDILGNGRGLAMYTDKKKISNARYLSKFKNISVRVTEEEKLRIEAAAAQRGESLAGFILAAIRKRIEE